MQKILFVFLEKVKIQFCVSKSSISVGNSVYPHFVQFPYLYHMIRES